MALAAAKESYPPARTRPEEESTAPVGEVLEGEGGEAANLVSPAARWGRRESMEGGGRGAACHLNSWTTSLFNFELPV